MRSMNFHVVCRALACIFCWLLYPLSPGLCFVLRSQWGCSWHQPYAGVEKAYGVVCPRLLSELEVFSSVSSRVGMKNANRRTMRSTVRAVMRDGEAECLDDPSKMRKEGLELKGGERNNLRDKGGDSATEAPAMEVNKPKRKLRTRKLKSPKLIKEIEDELVIKDNVVEEEGMCNTRAYFVLAFCGTEQQAFAEKCALRASERLGDLIDVRLINTGERITKKVPPARGDKWETLVYDPDPDGGEHLDIWIEGVTALSLYSSSAEDTVSDLPTDDDIQSYLVALEEETRIENQDIYPL